MEEEQENVNPNAGSPGLADVIRDNINFQHDQTIKRTLLKESLLKISLDKDFAHLFQPQPQLHHNPTPNPDLPKQSLLQVSEEIRDICRWLQESQQFCGMGYLPFNSTPRLLQVLHQKIQGTAIVVTEYPSFWVARMEEIGRLTKVKWGVLSAGQQAEEKVRVLELYELKRLKLLFVTPSLFRCEEYHQFQCDLLLLTDLHLYHNHHDLITKMITKTNPDRVLSLYHTLIPHHYNQHLSLHHMNQINKPKTAPFNFIILRTTPQDKFKTMMTYLSKNDFKRILILVNKRQEAYQLSKKLLLEPKTSINLFDYMSGVQMGNLTPEELLGGGQREEEKIFELIKRISGCEITIGRNTDFLRFCNFDVAIYYSFTDVVRFVESSFTTRQKLLLFEENDYHNYRNMITSDLVTQDNLQKIVMRMVERTGRREDHGRRRCYSEYIDDKLMQSYTVSKQLTQKDEQKVLRITSFCKRLQISNKLFSRILQALQQNEIISINYRTIYEIQVDIQCIPRLKKHFPSVQQIRRKINLLNLSTNLQKTIRTILDELKKEGIKYKITQQAIQIKILKNYEDINWLIVNEIVNKPIIQQATNLDRSFDTFKECAYSSLELTRREKALQKKEVILNFLNVKKDGMGMGSETDCFRGNQEKGSLLESYHKSNLLTSEIEEWIRHSEEITISEHELILLLQGVERGRVGRFKDDPIYGRYRKLKYEELMEAISKIYGNKRVKIE